MRRVIAVIVAKIIIIVGKVIGNKGSSLPGRFALLICPDILKELAQNIRCEIIAVCGTNGKTTTNNLLHDIIMAKGKKVVCNKIGANMLNGVVTAFVDKADWSGRLDADYASLEIDEISIPKVFEHFVPDILVVTNLFPDQFDRNGGEDIVLGHIRDSIEKAGKCTFVLNADDPFVSSLGFGKSNAVFFGVEQSESVQKWQTEGECYCPLCQNKLIYNFRHYSQLGNYACPNCNFVRPNVRFEATEVSLADKTSFTVEQISVCADLSG